MHSNRQSRVAALESIGFTWQVVKTAWDEKYFALQQWQRRNGHTCVPISHPELGSWVSKQRQSQKKGKLSLRKQNLLNAIDFTWSTSDADWDAKFAQLCQWKSKHGHSLVPFNEGGLGWWSNTQRQSRKKGKLCASREMRLETVGFIWNPSNRRGKEKGKSPGLGGVGIPISKRRRKNSSNSNVVPVVGHCLSDQKSPGTLRDIPESDCTSSSLAAWDDDFHARRTSAPFVDLEVSTEGKSSANASGGDRGPSYGTYDFSSECAQVLTPLRVSSVLRDQRPSDANLLSFQEPHIDAILPPILEQATLSSGISQVTWPQAVSLTYQTQSEQGFGRAPPECSQEILNLMPMY